MSDVAPPLELKLSPRHVTEALLEELRRTLARYPGHSPVLVHFDRTVLRLPEEYGVDVTSDVIGELRRMLGNSGEVRSAPTVHPPLPPSLPETLGVPGGTAREMARRFAIGAIGEEATARALSGLHRFGYYVFHDVDAGRGNYDHVLIGPGGVFLVDSSVARDLESKASDAWKGAARLGRAFRERGQSSVFVVPIVADPLFAIRNSVGANWVTVRDREVLAGDPFILANWISVRPDIVTDDLRARLAAAILQIDPRFQLHSRG